MNQRKRIASGERDDDRDRGDEVADGVEGEEQATQRRVDVAGPERQADDRHAEGDVRPG